MDDKPDFEQLRAERNALARKLIEAFAAEAGVPVSKVRTTFNPSACYCTCGIGGPCEHQWDGPVYEGESFSSATCSRCGMTAMSHDMRNW